MAETLDKFKKSPSTLPQKANESSKESKDVSALTESVSGSIDLDVEGAVEAGEISESNKSRASQNMTGVKGDGDDVSDVDKIKLELLKKMPSEKEMIKQIEVGIKKEIAALHKKSIKLVNMKDDASYFEFTNVVRKLRSLRTVLNGLLKNSFEGIKELWLRFVHGVR